jgi:prevent-host-death family protein
MKPVETISISRFRMTYSALLGRVRATGEPIRVTRYGTPVADIVPVTPELQGGRKLGLIGGTVVSKGDIMVPSSELVSWEALR